MVSQKYRGESMLIRQADVAKAVKHDATHWLLRRAGRKHRLYARATRLISGHFSQGEFRDRFNKEGTRRCVCDLQVAPHETRDHILYECPVWVRAHKPPPREPKAERLDEAPAEALYSDPRRGSGGRDGGMRAACQMRLRSRRRRSRRAGRRTAATARRHWRSGDGGRLWHAAPSRSFLVSLSFFFCALAARSYLSGVHMLIPGSSESHCRSALQGFNAGSQDRVQNWAITVPVARNPMK